jgi:Macrocin-O-methyltransferase (TylF)
LNESKEALPYGLIDEPADRALHGGRRQEGIIRRWLTERLKRWAYRSELLAELSGPSYRYCLEVSELCAIADAITATKGQAGRVVEMGVARGMTTAFLNTHLDALGDSRKYLAIDTFAGFTPEDIAFEVAHRGKNRDAYWGFTYNDEKVFRRNMARLGFDRVEVLRLDVNHLETEHLGRVSVAILDVDLYRPTLRALEVTYEVLEDGGYIFVDDVSPGTVYDGAGQAYLQFTERMGLERIQIGGKCGLIRK